MQLATGSYRQQLTTVSHRQQLAVKDRSLQLEVTEGIWQHENYPFASLPDLAAGSGGQECEEGQSWAEAGGHLWLPSTPSRVTVLRLHLQLRIT